MDPESKKLQDFLTSIQLGQFYGKFVEKLHITRLDHFDHVIEQDLKSLNMSMPEIRRLFDHLRKFKRRSGSFLSKLKKSFRTHGSTQSISGPISMDQTFHVAKDDLNCLVLLKELSFKEVLGNGAFGVVKKAEWVKTGSTDKVSVAVKCLQEMPHNSLANLQNVLLEEGNAMSNLNHPNLIRLFGVVLELNSPAMLVTELAPLGSLLERLQQEPDKFLISTLCSFVVQIAAGMKYLEANRFVHRDLAARNILLMSYEKIKIGDFGLSRTLQNNKDYYIMNSGGLVPYAWCAPECLNYRKFSHASDVWAFGITIIELFSYGVKPWAGIKGSEILKRIDEPNCERPSCPAHCPSGVYSIIHDLCWNHQPERRGQFAILEKCLLNVLPREVTALNTRLADNDDDLSFKKGDVITVFDTVEDLIWKGQNRTTRQVGYIPSEFVDHARGTITDLFSEQHDGLVSGNIKSRLNTSESCKDVESQSTWYDGVLSLNNNLGPKLSPNMKELERRSADDSVFTGTGSPFDKPGQCYSRSSICEECESSSMSNDSGCYCRCSTYSSDSSTRTSDTSGYNYYTQSESQPIVIPGGMDSRRNHNEKTADTNIYQMFPYESHKLRSSTPKSNDGDSVPERFYNKVKGIMSPGKVSKSVEERRTLPDLVAPNKKTNILNRRKSLPRLRSKKTRSYENKLFGSQFSLSRSLSPAPSCADDMLNKFNNSIQQPIYDVILPKAEEKKAKSVQELYDVIPPKVEESKTEPLRELYDIVPPNIEEPKTGPLKEFYDVLPPKAVELKTETFCERYDVLPPKGEEPESKPLQEHYDVVPPKAEDLKTQPLQELYDVLPPKGEEQKSEPLQELYDVVPAKAEELKTQSVQELYDVLPPKGEEPKSEPLQELYNVVPAKAEDLKTQSLQELYDVLPPKGEKPKSEPVQDRYDVVPPKAEGFKTEPLRQLHDVVTKVEEPKTEALSNRQEVMQSDSVSELYELVVLKKAEEVQEHMEPLVAPPRNKRKQKRSSVVALSIENETISLGKTKQCVILPS